MNPLPRMLLLQYVAIAAPVFVPTVADAPQTYDRWKPVYADRVPAAPRTIVYHHTGEPEPVFVPAAPADPQTLDRWKPRFADRVPGAPPRLPSTADAPILVPAVEDAPQTMDRWSPRYVDRAPRRQAPVIESHHTSEPTPAFVPGLTVPTFSWQPKYPDSFPPKRLLTSAQSSLMMPPVQPLPTVSEGGYIIATGSVPILQYQALAGPFSGDIPAPAPEPTAFVGYYDPKTYAKPGLHASRQQAWAFDVQWGAPAAPAVPNLVVVQYPPPPLRPYPRAVYTWGQQHFAVVVQVPVMSWTGLYLDPPMKRRVRFQPEPRPFPLDYDVTINPPTPTFAWQPSYPERLNRAKPRLTSEAVAPLFIAEVTTGATPALSWQGVFAERVWPARSLRTAAQPAFFSDKFTAPTVVPAPDLAIPVYVDRVFGRAPLTWSPEFIAPLHVPDVTHPVTALSWLPTFPDTIIRVRMPVAAMPFGTRVEFLLEYVPVTNPDIVLFTVAVIRHTDGTVRIVRALDFDVER